MLIRSIVKPEQEGHVPIHPSPCHPPCTQYMAPPILGKIPLCHMRHRQRNANSQSPSLHHPSFSIPKDFLPRSKPSPYNNLCNTFISRSPSKSTRVQYIHTRLFRVNSLPLRACDIILCTESKVGHGSGVAGSEHALENISRYLWGGVFRCCRWLRDGNWMEKVCKSEDHQVRRDQCWNFFGARPRLLAYVSVHCSR
jgi:hypothetical protein